MAIAKIPQPIDVIVGGRVRQQRIRMGMSQEKLGKALGISFQQIQKYEKGTNRIGASRLSQIAAALGISPAALFPDTDAPSTVELPAFDAMTLRVANNFNRIENQPLRLSLAHAIAAAAHVEEEAA